MRNATGVMTASMGGLMGMAGIEHGIGEILQGSTAPAGLMIQSWPGSAFFHSMGGEPALTVIPNLLVTGILAVFFSLAYGVWVIFMVQRKNGGLVLILLALGMLLVGGGIFPPIIGAGIGILRTRIQAPDRRCMTRIPAGLRRFLGQVWPGSFVVCIMAWLALFPGINILAYFLRVDDPQITVSVILLALAALLLAIFSGFAYDANMEKALDTDGTDRA